MQEVSSGRLAVDGAASYYVELDDWVVDVAAGGSREASSSSSGCGCWPGR